MYKWLGLVMTVMSVFALAADVPGFRGENRSGVFNESQLLKSWPEGGPRELWTFEGLHEGYASLAVEDGIVYTTGKDGDVGYAFAIGADGKLLWKESYGAEFNGRGYPGARSTPTLDGDLLYITNGFGKVIALKKKSGKKVWEYDMASHGGQQPRFGYAESVFVLDDLLYCTPGGSDAGVVALNKKTGKVAWTSVGLSDNASYCAIRLFEHKGKKKLLTLTANGMVALDPKSGALLWRQEYPAKYDIHAVSPVFDGDFIYVSDGYKQGGKAFRVNADGSGVEEIWSEQKLDIHHGGAIYHQGHVYGAASGGTWMVLDAKDGSVKGRFRDIGKGSAVMADGLIYGYDERGRVALIDPNTERFGVISKFEITKGSGQHWNHPVISGGKLYIRHGNALMCFDIKAGRT